VQLRLALAGERSSEEEDRVYIGVASARGCTQQFSAEYQCRTKQNYLCYCYVLNTEAPHSVIKLPKNYKLSEIH
jgi:hypothetical protein